MGSIEQLVTVAGSGLTANREWMNLVSGNIANANTTRTEDGGAFRRQLAIMRERVGQDGDLEGVEVASVEEDPAPLKQVYEPEHPDAGPDGYVEYPNVDVVTEMVDMISAQRAYESNATVLETAKSLAQRTIGLMRI